MTATHRQPWGVDAICSDGGMIHIRATRPEDLEGLRPRRVSATKPILAVKSGRSDAGRRAGQSHTAVQPGLGSMPGMMAQFGTPRPLARS
jgi:hypothetical protein